VILFIGYHDLSYDSESRSIDLTLAEVDNLNVGKSVSDCLYAIRKI